jgi:hypothetical protein
VVDGVHALQRLAHVVRLPDVADDQLDVRVQIIRP